MRTVHIFMPLFLSSASLLVYFIYCKYCRAILNGVILSNDQDIPSREITILKLVVSGHFIGW